MAYADTNLGEVDWAQMFNQGITAFSTIKAAQLNYKTAKVQAQSAQNIYGGFPGDPGATPFPYNPSVPPTYAPPKKPGVDMTTVLMIGAAAIAVILLTMKKKGH